MSAATAIEDQLLVLSCQDGNAEAVTVLVRRWQPRLWRHARVLTGRDDAAWDVIQEAWLAIVDGLHRLLDASQFRAWAYRIVTHKSTDWVRRQQRGRKLLQDVADQQPPEEQTASRGPEAVAEQSEQATALRQALRKLGVEQQAVLTLFYLEELSLAEIAVALAIPPGTVKSRLFHARQELKEVWRQTQPAALTEERLLP